MTRLLARLRGRLSYANVTASLALFIALGGTGYAATRLPRDSVASPQIVNRSILSGDLAASAKPRIIEIYVADPGRESYATVNRRAAGRTVGVTRGSATLPGVWNIKVKPRKGEICTPAGLVRRSTTDITFDVVALGTGSTVIENEFSISTERPDGTTADVPFYLSVICLPR